METTSLGIGRPIDTREKIIRMMRRAPRTVEELAAALGITRNAVRSQVNILLREGIAEPQGTVPSGRRPATLFGIRRDAAALFSKASPVVLSQLVKILSERLSDQEFSDTAEELGLRLADLAPKPSGGVQDRLRTTAGFLESLGSMVDIHEEKDRIRITGHGCPIAGAVEADGRLCRAMATMVGSLVGLPAEERCNRNDHPGCCFEIKLP